MTKQEEIDLIKIRLNATIREVWCFLRDLSDYEIEGGDVMADVDFDLWSAVTKHPAVQDNVKKRLDNRQQV